MLAACSVSFASTMASDSGAHPEIRFVGRKAARLACEHNAPAVFQDAARELDRILDASKPPPLRRRAKRVTFHDCRIHLDFTEAVQRRAGAGIEQRIVFENNDSGFHGVERSAALLKNRRQPASAAVLHPSSRAARLSSLIGPAPPCTIIDGE